MKRILILIFFSLALTALPHTASAHLPVLFGLDYASTTLGHTLEFSVIASDVDGDPLILSSQLPESALWATSTGVFSWTPTATSSLGTTTAIFFASDRKGTTTHQVVLEVFQEATGTATGTPNSLPIFSGPTIASTTLGSLIEFVVTATDTDQDALNLASAIPDGASWEATTTGIFSWTPTATSSLGTSTAKFFASDGTGTTTHEVVIEVFPQVATTTQNSEITNASTTPAIETPPPSPIPQSSGGGGSSGGSSSGSSGRGSGGPLGQFGVSNTQAASSDSGSIAPVIVPQAPTKQTKKPTTISESISAPISDSVPLKPEGGIINIKPTSSSPIAASKENRFFGLGALSLLGLLNIWNWLKANCSVAWWLIWLITAVAFLLYIAKLKRETKKEVPENLEDSETVPMFMPPAVRDHEINPETEWEWKKLAQEEDNLL